jgi:hypothetical protein
VSTDNVAVTDANGVTLSAEPILATNQVITITIDGLTPGATYDVSLHSTPIALGTVTANASGVVTYSFTVPASLAAGTHSVQLAGPGGVIAAAFVFQAAASNPATAAGTGSSLANTGFAAASISVLALLMLVVGAGIVFSARRRLFVRGKHH